MHIRLPKRICHCWPFAGWCIGQSLPVFLLINVVAWSSFLPFLFQYVRCSFPSVICCLSCYFQFAGTDEATTCVGLVIRNRQSGRWDECTLEKRLLLIPGWFLTGAFVWYLRTSVAHVDSPDVVELGLTQMLSGISSGDSRAELDVLLLSYDLAILFTNSRRYILMGDFFIMACRCI